RALHEYPVFASLRTIESPTRAGQRKPVMRKVSRIFAKIFLRSLAAMLAILVFDSMVGAQVRNFKPVTDAMLENPDPGDWINWRRTLNAWGYSPLQQINKQNVHQLQLAWTWAMAPGDSEPTPLVYNGVMYLPNPRGVVQALDAATGDFIWEYKKELEAPPKFLSVMRNLAIYDDKIFVNTPDAHIV